MQKRILFLLPLLVYLLAACASPATPTTLPPADDETVPSMFFSADLQRTGLYDGQDVLLPDAPAWEFEAGEWIFTVPAVVEDVVYFGSYDGRVYAVSAAEGEELWQFATADIVISSPAVVGEQLYFGSNDGNIYALDRRSGAEIWRYETGGAVTASPAVAGGKVIVGSEDGFLYALSTQSGEMLWRADFASPVVFEASVADDKVFAASADAVLGVLDLASGQLLWQYDLESGSTITAGPVVTGDAVYLLGSGIDLVGRLHAIDISEQVLRWTFKLPTEAFVSPAVTDDLAFVTALGGTLHAIEVDTGRERWLVRTPEPAFSSPAIAGHSLYFGSWGDQALYSVDIRNGRVQWQLPLGSGVSSPAVSGDTVYVGTEDGRLAALR